MSDGGPAPARSAPAGRLTPQQVAFAGIFTVTLLGLLSIGVTLPVLPLYVHGPIGAGDVAVGVVTGAFAITGLTLRPLAGHLADTRGRRRVMVAGALLMALAGVLYLVPAGVPGLIVVRLVLGAGEALIFGAGAAWVVDLSPPRKHGRVIGLYGLAIWGALALGPPIGELLLRASSFEMVWAFAAVTPLLGAAIALRIPEPYRPRVAEAHRFAIPREALTPGLALSLATVGQATLSAFVVLHLDQIGVGHGAVVLTAFAASVVAIRIIGGGIPDRLGPARSAAAAGLIEAVGLAMIAVAESLTLALLGAMVMGAAFSLMFPSLALLVVRRIPAERRGVALGTFTSFFDLGVGVGTPAAGAFAALSGYPAAFAFAAACAVGTFVVASAIALGRLRLPRSAPAR
jgi:MFS family permease